MPSSKTGRSSTAQLSKILARLRHLRPLLVVARTYSNAPWLMSTQPLRITHLCALQPGGVSSSTATPCHA